jgi:hypothetical protein
MELFKAIWRLPVPRNHLAGRRMRQLGVA